MIELYLSEDEWRTWVHLMETLHEKSDATTFDDGDLLTIQDKPLGEFGSPVIQYARSAAAICDFGAAEASREDSDREAGKLYDQ